MRWSTVTCLRARPSSKGAHGTNPLPSAVVVVDFCAHLAGASLCSYDLINSQEKGAQTARDLVYEQQRTAYMMRRWIPPPSKPDPILTVLHAEPVRKNLMLCLPLVGLCGIGLALELLFQVSPACFVTASTIV